MDLFSDLLLRLKHSLRVSKDQEVADFLGLSRTAFSERKKRNAFPEKELRALARQRPELGIDVEYVLTGISTEARGRLDAKQARVSRALDEGYDIADVRDMEALATGATPMRLIALGAMLGKMQAAEFDAIYTLVSSNTEMRRTLAQRGQKDQT